jgi:DUF1680 family protein
MGERVYAHAGQDIWTVLYMGSTTTVPLKDGKVKLTQKTNYPWDGKVEITLQPERTFEFGMNLRIPGWCRSPAAIRVNGKAVEASPSKGYQRIVRQWRAGDVIELELAMSVERVHADPRVKADVGRVALQRGPVVFCLEGVDNRGHVRNLCLPRESDLTARFDKDLLGGVEVVRGGAQAVSRGKGARLVTRPVEFQAVPYFAWDNRKPGEMAVWLPEKPQLAAQK